MDIAIGGYPGNLFAQKVTIPTGALGVSEMIATQGRNLIAIIMPNSWTAAAIGFKGCITGRADDLLHIYDKAGNLEQTLAAASKLIDSPLTDPLYVPYLQLSSVVAGAVTPVNQAADRDLILLFRNHLT